MISRQHSRVAPTLTLPRYRKGGNLRQTNTARRLRSLLCGSGGALGWGQTRCLPLTLNPQPSTVNARSATHACVEVYA
jgi:hypothetical protein